MSVGSGGIWSIVRDGGLWPTRTIPGCSRTRLCVFGLRDAWWQDW